MISVLGILPNGEPVADQSTAMAFWMIILVLVISLAWFAALSFLTARWFEKKEVSFVANEKGVRDFKWTLLDLSQQSQVGSREYEVGSTQRVNRIFESAGLYPIVLVVSNEFNCYDTIIKPITVLPDLGVYIPNAFSPNGDYKNEIFMPVIRAAQSIYFVVFDRWGEKLFETTELNVGWDGTFRGAACKQDVYMWKLNVQGFSGEAHGLTNEKKFSGQVLLMR